MKKSIKEERFSIFSFKSGTTVDRDSFVLSSIHAEDGIAESHTHDKHDADVAVVSHYEHHIEDVHQTINENKAEGKYLLDCRLLSGFFLLLSHFWLLVQKTTLLLLRKQASLDSVLQGRQANWKYAHKQSDYHPQDDQNRVALFNCESG